MKQELDLYRYDQSVIPGNVESEFQELESEILTEQHGQLTLIRNLVKGTQKGRFFKRILSADDAMGVISGETVFVRIKRSVIKKNDLVRHVVWELAPEVAGQVIVLSQRVKNKEQSGEIFIGFITQNPYLAARGASYDLKTGELKTPEWGKKLGNRPNTEIIEGKLEYGDCSQTENGVIFFGELDGYQEETFFPKKIDINQLMPEIIDEKNSVVRDQNNPWANWFRGMGIRVSFVANIPIKQDS